MKLFLLLIFFFSLNTFAGYKTGNGGFIAVCLSSDNAIEPLSIEVLDLFEAKLKKNRKFHFNIFNSVDENINLILQRIASRDLWLSLELEKKYHFLNSHIKFLSNLNDFKITDINFSLVPYKTGCFLQLAIVQVIIDNERWYLINKQIWKSLTNEQKSYLILHELYYSFLLQTMPNLDNSDAVREFVSDIAFER